ncbi:hypothetical protein MMC34_004664 [Xylographa carneopallida]|nr:hypothetical protein [Xylographa carneopallida]
MRVPKCNSSDQTYTSEIEKRRIVCYHQTHYDDGKYVSILPLFTHKTGVTHVIVAAIHLNQPAGNITLNDDPYKAVKYDPLWAEIRQLQNSGIKVLGMLGDGLDLDVEEAMSIAAVIRLIDHLKADFGIGFLITLAPVVPAMRAQQNLSGFDYKVLEKAFGYKIA